MFSDEKLFVTDAGFNSQNNRIYAYSREEADSKQISRDFLSKLRVRFIENNYLNLLKKIRLEK
jgi:hypothetical protein